MTSTPQPTAKATDLELLLSELSTQNSRYVSAINQLESIGHKLRNTEYPKSEQLNKSEPEPAPDGILQCIGLQLEYMLNHNNRLEEIVNKLSGII